MHRIAGVRRGFTLVELLIVLAIAALLAAAAAPALGGLLARVHGADFEASIADTLRQARAAAVLRNTRVIVCPSADGRQCLGGFDWQQGWIVGVDRDHDGRLDPDQPLLASQAVAPAGSRVITSSGRTRLMFQPTGSAGGSNATFTVCHVRARRGHAVVIANSGRVRIGPPEPDRLAECLAAAGQPS